MMVGTGVCVCVYVRVCVCVRVCVYVRVCVCVNNNNKRSKGGFMIQQLDFLYVTKSDDSFIETTTFSTTAEFQTPCVNYSYAHVCKMSTTKAFNSYMGTSCALMLNKNCSESFHERYKNECSFKSIVTTTCENCMGQPCTQKSG